MEGPLPSECSAADIESRMSSKRRGSTRSATAELGDSASEQDADEESCSQCYHHRDERTSTGGDIAYIDPSSAAAAVTTVALLSQRTTREDLSANCEQGDGVPPEVATANDGYTWDLYGEKDSGEAAAATATVHNNQVDVEGRSTQNGDGCFCENHPHGMVSSGDAADDCNTKDSGSDGCEEDDEMTTCGCCGCRMQCLQRLATPPIFLLAICFLVLTQTFLVAGYSNSILTTIERRYNLRSSELGLIAGSYDVTCMIAIIIVSYFGDKYNRAKWMGCGAIIMGIGAVVFTMPHFLGGPYKMAAVTNDTKSDILCNVSRKGVLGTGRDCSIKNPETWALTLFIIAQLTIGVGTSPIYSLGPTYLYDNVKSNVYSVYAGIMYSMVALGPALGFLTGAYFLSFYVDFLTEPNVNITEKDEGWVGAWWMGFILSAFLSFLTAIPLLMFPRKLPNVKVVGDVDIDDANAPVSPSFFTNIKDFPYQMWKLLKNPTWLFISLVFVTEQSITTGFVTFVAKYFQVSFDTPASVSNIYTGACIIPAAFIGIILGGVFMKKLELTLQGISSFLVGLNFLPTIGILTLLFLGCPTLDLTGVTSYYGTTVSQPNQLRLSPAGERIQPKLTATCNVQCACPTAVFDPVCGSDGKTYFSACHAGCTTLHVHHQGSGTAATADNSPYRNYSSCGCVGGGFSYGGVPAATGGRCERHCRHLVAFLVLLFLIILITSIGQNPLLLVTLRCVDPESRSFALGIQNVLFRIFAAIPAPIYFGRIFDSTCLVSAESCDDSGACLVYDTEQLPYIMFGTAAGLKGLTFLFMFLTYLSCRCTTDKHGMYELELKDADAKKAVAIVASTGKSPVGVIGTTYLQSSPT